ncbi:hypothetical protein BVG16_13510 [Paenibacillus selenitireducens]|uniref:Uncharacterized protein n=1 Tax=Paenibacillus selenitireducens TaxID=1324314 RepID=A0A1T2XC30_9BACL|nr:hypothetical protein [Paenibacillus selenitireducens]OPA77467.1 hypothetical protein BVG16_13510 [Paenibacillus selenitireducens]
MPSKKNIETEHEEETELSKLINRKIELANKLGIMDDYNPIDNYQGTEEYKELQEIDKRLWELVK